MGAKNTELEVYIEKIALATQTLKLILVARTQNNAKTMEEQS